MTQRPDEPSPPMKAIARVILPKYLLYVRLIHEKEMWHSVVGSYPVQQFLDDFLPLPDGIYPSSIPSFDFSGVSTTKQEAESYDSLVRLGLLLVFISQLTCAIGQCY